MSLPIIDTLLALVVPALCVAAVGCLADWEARQPDAQSKLIDRLTNTKARPAVLTGPLHPRCDREAGVRSVADAATADTSPEKALASTGA